MRPTEIESWALSIIDSVVKGQPVEDVRVELKSEWPADEHEAARRIAAHANAAHGEPVLWLIGVDEKGRQVVGGEYSEVANWWPRVKSFFNELPPDLVHLNVPYEEKTVAALLFDTERRPFVVKVPGGGHIDLEVPWRDGTAVRSAKRRELITVLSAMHRNPTVEVLRGSLHISRNLGGRYSGTHGLTLDVYVVPGNAEKVVIPYHHCVGTLRFTCAERQFAFRSVSFEKRRDATITCTPTEMITDSPGLVTIRAFPPDLAELGRIAFSPTVCVELKLQPAGSELAVSVTAELTEGISPSDTTRHFSMRAP